MDRRRWLVVPLLLSLAACSGGGATTAASTSPTTSPSPMDTQAVTVTATVTDTATTPAGPSPAEVKYLAALAAEAAESSDEPDDDPPSDADVIAEGRLACAFYRGAEHPPQEDLDATDDDAPAPEAASDREVAMFFLDANGYYDEAAIKYLCPKLLDELAWAKAGFTEGDTEVGGKNGIKPGQYHAEGPVSDCYWERVTSGGSTRANDFIKYAPKGVTVTVRSSDGGINTQGCGSWLPVKRP